MSPRKSSRYRKRIDDSILSLSNIKTGHGGRREGAGNKQGSKWKHKCLSPKARPQHHLAKPRKRPRGALTPAELAQLDSDHTYRQLLAANNALTKVSSEKEALLVSTFVERF